MSLQTALNTTAANVNGSFIIGNLVADMAIWNAGWPIIFNELDVNQRTVRDWFVQSQMIELNYASPPNESDLQKTVDVVIRILEAGIAAESSGRISAGQATALEAAYNAAW